MIQRLLKLLGVKMPEEKVDVPAVDLDDIYVQLKLAIDKASSTEIRLTASPASLGSIESFSDTLEGLYKSLLEINSLLKERQHIQNALFHSQRVKTVKFDKFLFVQDGYYADEVPARVQRVVEQIDMYYGWMKDAGTAPYGVMEHNHRQLYGYTQTLTMFLETLLRHFGE